MDNNMEGNLTWSCLDHVNFRVRCTDLVLTPNWLQRGCSTAHMQRTSGQHMELIRGWVLLKLPWEPSIFKCCAEQWSLGAHKDRG